MIHTKITITNWKYIKNGQEIQFCRFFHKIVMFILHQKANFPNIMFTQLNNIYFNKLLQFQFIQKGFPNTQNTKKNLLYISIFVHRDDFKYPVNGRYLNVVSSGKHFH